MRSSSRNGKTDNLLAYAEAQDIPVYYGSLPLTQSLSVCANGKSYIAIDPGQVASSADGRVKIAHELGHCKTGSFYTRYSRADVLEKHEYRADKWAVHRLMPLEELEEAVRLGYTEWWQLADYFDVTEAFVKRALYLYACEGCGGLGAPREDAAGERAEAAPDSGEEAAVPAAPLKGVMADAMAEAAAMDDAGKEAAPPVSRHAAAASAPPAPEQAAAAEEGGYAPRETAEADPALPAASRPTRQDTAAASSPAVPAKPAEPITTLGQLLRYMVDCEQQRAARPAAAPSARRVDIDIVGEK